MSDQSGEHEPVDDGLIHVGDDLWLRANQVDGVKTEWSEVAIGRGYVFVLVADQWLRATQCSESVVEVHERHSRLVAALSGSNKP